MLHHNKDNTAYHAPQTMGSDGPGREVEGGDGRVRWTHDDQHNGEGAMRTHSLYLSISLSLPLCCTSFSSLSYKGKRMGSYAEGQRELWTIRHNVDPTTGAHEHALTAGKEAGRTLASSRQQLP